MLFSIKQYPILLAREPSMFGSMFSNLQARILSLVVPPDHGVPLPSGDRMCEAEFNAAEVRTELLCFQRSIKQEFPHRTDAVTLVDQVLQTLSLQHGGFEPAVILFQWTYEGKLPVRHLTAEQRRTIVQIVSKWENRDQVKQEFWALDRERRMNEALTEERIAEIVAFMEQWLQKQKTEHPLARRPHLD